MSLIVGTGGCGFIGFSFTHHTVREDAGVRIAVQDGLTCAGDHDNIDGPPVRRVESVVGNVFNEVFVVYRLFRRAMARSLEREAMYAVVIDPISGYDTGIPSGWIATNALMAANDPRFADEFWEAVEERGGLHRPVAVE